MFRTRCLMQLVSRERLYWVQPAERLKFIAQYDTGIPAEKRFFDATPSGDITILVNNQEVLNEMVLGEKYYVDFTKAKE